MLKCINDTASLKCINVNCKMFEDTIEMNINLWPLNTLNDQINYMNINLNVQYVFNPKAIGNDIYLKTKQSTCLGITRYCTYVYYYVYGALNTRLEYIAKILVVK